MPEQSYEDRYESYLELLRDNTPTLAELDAIERQIGRLNHAVAYAKLSRDRRWALLELRNKTSTALAAAWHRARIDDARAAVAAAASQRATPEERRRNAARQQTAAAPAPSTQMRLRPRSPRAHDRGIDR